MINLKQLILVDCDMIKDDGLQNLLTKSVNLCKLSIHGCKEITGKGLDFQHNKKLHSFTLSECKKVGIQS